MSAYSGDSLVPPHADANAFPAVDAPPASIDAVGPNMGHTGVMLVLTAVFVTVTQFAMLIIAQKLGVFGHHSLRTYAELLAHDARWLVPSEAVGYLLVLAAAVPLFRVWWDRTFAHGVHWNGAVAIRRAWLLVLAGLGCGFGMALLGSVLPMPKNPPIELDLLGTQLGAWMMFLFGVTGAPLFEELFFRGFLLPAFVNAFRWLHLRDDLSASVYRWVGLPLATLLTSAPFALLHAPQVSQAWGPLLLIGLVSLVLCAVRLSLNSLAASTVVHAAYNFTLFAGLLVQTGGFRHLDKMTS